MNRRQLLQSFSGVAATTILTPELAQAAAQLSQGAASGINWQIAFADLDADLARAPMKRIHGRAPEAWPAASIAMDPASSIGPAGPSITGLTATA